MKKKPDIPDDSAGPNNPGKNLPGSRKPKTKDRSKEDLKASEERFRAAAEYTRDWESLIDPSGKLIWVNRSVERIAGYSPAECLSMRDYPLPIIHDEDRGFIKRRFLDAMRGRRIDDLEFRILRKDGTLRWCSVSSQLVYDSKGRPLGHRSSVRDISKRKRAEEALRESELRFREFFDNMTSGVAVYLAREDGADFVFADINESGQRLNAVKKELAIGHPVTEIFPGIEKMGLLDVFRRVWKSGIPESFLSAHYADDHLSQWLDNRVFKLPSGEIVAVYEDITNRIMHEETLRKVNEQLVLAQQSSRAGVWDWDLTTNKIEWSAELFRLLGLDPNRDAASFDIWRSALHPADAAEAEERITEALQKHVQLKSEYRIVLPSGETRWIHSLGDAIRDADGTPRHMMGICLDVTERKRAETELQESRNNLLRAETLGHIGNWEWKISEQKLTWSDELYRIWGVPKDFPLTFESIEALIHPDDLARNATMVQRLMEKEERTAIEFRIVRPDGTVRHIHQMIEVSLDGSGKVDRAFGVMQDITERKQAEQECSRQAEFLQRLIDALPYPIFYKDRRGRYLGCNTAYERFFGFERDRIVGKSAEALHPADLAAVYAKSDEDLLLHPGKQFYESVIQSRDGVRHDVIFHKATFGDSRGNPAGLIGSALDITSRKEAEDALRKSESRLRKVFEILPVGLWFADKNGKLLTGNPAGVKIWGGEPRVGPEDYGVFHARRLPSGREIAPEDWALAHTVKEGVTVVDEMLEIDAFDGKKKTILNYTAPLMDNEERIEGAVVVNLDISELRAAADRLKSLLEATIRVISGTIEIRDPYTAGHQKRVAHLASAIARELGLSDEDIETIWTAATIHDLGKIAVPSEILSKPTTLTELEFEIIKTHSRQGYEILKNIEFKGPVPRIILEHHERMDGSGYPDGLKGEEILLESRILAVADIVEAMASHRPYRPAIGIEGALEEIEKNQGKRYDPAVVGACLRLFMEKRFAWEKETTA